MKLYRGFILLLAMLLLCGSALAEVVFNEDLSAFPVQEGEGWAENGPLPFNVEESREGLLEIWFGRVSVCDCIVIRCNGETMMIDGGTKSFSNHTRTLLDNLGITHVDYLFNTHAHDDHIEAQELQVRKYNMQVGTFLSPYEQDYRNTLHQKMVATVTDKGIPYRTLHHGDTMMLGGDEGALIEFFRWEDGPSLNYSSMMCKVTYKERSVFLTADVTGLAQQVMMDEYRDEIPWDSDIFKLGHHGYSRQEAALLEAVSPDLCIVTNSAKGAESSINQLKKLELEYRITNAGTIYARTDGGECWEYTQDKSYLNK